MAAEKKKDWASGEEYSVTAVRSDGRGPTQEQINKNLGQTQNTAASTAAVSPTTTNTNQTQQNQQTAQRTMQTSTAVSNAAGNPPAVNTAALRQQAANVTANKAKYANTEQFKTYLADWLANAQQQQTNRIDYATRQGVNALNQAAEEANAQYATQQTQIDADEARARDNQALYAAARGDRGGIGAAQYDSIANTAMQNRVTVQNAQTKMATDTARQIADLRAQGEYEKADALLNLSQQYLSQLMSLEQWAQQYNLNVDQFNAQLDQWAAEYNFQLQQADLSAWQWQTQYNRGVFESDRAYDYQVGRDTVDDSHWQKAFDYQREQDTLDRAERASRYAVDDSHWKQTFDYEREQDALNRAERADRYAVDDTHWEAENQRANQSLQHSIAMDTRSAERADRSLQHSIAMDTRSQDRADRQLEISAAESERDRAISLADSMISVGVVPDAATLAAAGISEADARLMASAVNAERSAKIEGAATKAANASTKTSGTKSTAKTTMALSEAKSMADNDQWTEGVYQSFIANGFTDNDLKTRYGDVFSSFRRGLVGASASGGRAGAVISPTAVNAADRRTVASQTQYNPESNNYVSREIKWLDQHGAGDMSSPNSTITTRLLNYYKKGRMSEADVQYIFDKYGWGKI